MAIDWAKLVKLVDDQEKLQEVLDKIPELVAAAALAGQEFAVLAEVPLCGRAVGDIVTALHQVLDGQGAPHVVESDLKKKTVGVVVRVDEFVEFARGKSKSSMSNDASREHDLFG